MEQAIVAHTTHDNKRMIMFAVLRNVHIVTYIV